MAYSIDKCKLIATRVDEIGISETAIEFGIANDSVKRALRYVRQHEREDLLMQPKDEIKKQRNECVINGGNTVLCIGDLHTPFDLDEYFDHCCMVYNKVNPNIIVFIGDVIDNHYSSYHESDPDGMGGRDELDLAIERLKRWYKMFPDAYVTIGNHDRMVMRKSQTSHVPRRWIKSYKEVLETPNWYFTDRVDIDNVQYIHGEAGTARIKCKTDMMSTVQGHLHTQAYVDWQIGRSHKVFGCQVGCGIDFNTYAMSYAKQGKKPAVGCAVIIDGINCTNWMMDL
tara:strand:- start:13702 stop:14553 length:852 start_codon:yes stop_codon:yes gene_type:complete